MPLEKLTMLNYLQSHPALVFGGVWVLAIALLLFLYWRRNGARSDPPASSEFDITDFWIKGIAGGIIKRLDMRPRYVAKRVDPIRSHFMAAQILADQAVAGETVGETTHAPAPGERGYEPPMHAFRVKVADYTIILSRDGTVSVQEWVSRGMTRTQPISKPEADVVAAMVLEIVRLRHD